ncbi:MAG: tetratricopeptide repeat protein [Pyrinomonadaceae bacterium]
MEIKFFSKSLFVALVIIAGAENSAANLRLTHPTFQQTKIVEKTSDDIEGGTSVFVFVKNNAAKYLSKKHTSVTQKNFGCASAQCQRRRDLSANAPKISLSIQAQKSLALGNQFFKDGKYLEAVTAFQKSVRLKPNYQAYFGLGEAQSELKQTSEAVKSYEQAVKLNPKLDEAHYNIGVIRYEQKSYAEALSPLQQAVNTAPALAEEYYYYGLTLNELKRKEEAIAALRETIKLDPKFGEAYQNLAELYNELDRKADAVALLRQSVKADPNNGNAFIELGIVNFNDKNYADALAAYKEAVRLLPNNATALAYLGDTEFSLKEYANALVSYQKALQMKPDLKNDSEFLTRYGYAQLNENKFPEAIKLLTEATQINPKDNLSFFGIGNAQMQSSPPNYPSAIEALNKSAALDPQFADTFILLAQAYTFSVPPNPTAASQAAQRAVTLAPDNPWMHFFAGLPLSQIGLHEEAAKSFKEAARLEPNNGAFRLQTCNISALTKEYQAGMVECQQAIKLLPPETVILGHLGLAQIYIGTKRYDEAIATSQAVIRQYPNSPYLFQAHNVIAGAYFTMKKLDKALVAFKESIRLNPQFAYTHYGLGLLYWDKGNKTEALQEYGILQNLNPQLAEQLKVYMTTNKSKK